MCKGSLFGPLRGPNSFLYERRPRVARRNGRATSVARCPARGAELVKFGEVFAQDAQRVAWCLVLEQDGLDELADHGLHVGVELGGGLEGEAQVSSGPRSSAAKTRASVLMWSAMASLRSTSRVPELVAELAEPEPVPSSAAAVSLDVPPAEPPAEPPAAPLHELPAEPVPPSVVSPSPIVAEENAPLVSERRCCSRSGNAAAGSVVWGRRVRSICSR